MNNIKIPNTIILITLAIGFIMATLDASIMNVAIVTIQKSLNLTNSEGSWLIDSYLLSFASLLLLGGALANYFGSKIIYQIGLILFIVGSIFGGISESGMVLISARFIQGIGAALFMPASLSLLVLSFTDKKERAKMLGIWSAIVSIASGIGPFIGGILIATFGWRSIFFVNVPFGIIGLILAFRYTINPAANKMIKVTFFPNLLSMVVLGTFAFFLIEGGENGFKNFYVISSFIIFLIGLSVFYMYENKSKSPLIPREFLINKLFIFSNVTAFFLNASMMGGLFIFGLYLQHAEKSSALGAGTKLLPMMLVFLIGNLIFSKAVQKIGVQSLLIFGLGLAAFGTLILVFSLNLPYIIYAIIYAIANLGVGIVVPAMTTTAMQSVPDKYSNSASSLFNVARQIGSLFGVAFLGIIFTQSNNAVLGTQLSFSAMLCFYVIGLILSIRRN